MNSKFMLTIQEVLSRPLFQESIVLAGNGRLDRIVRWVHILEVSDFEQLIHGEEMILTTGIAFQSDLDSPIQYLERLIKKNVSCLCIEMSAHFKSVPPEMIELAERHQFPLIIFPHTVRFVDITQDLHALIINRHHKLLQDLEKVSREFNRLTLTSQGISNVLKLLQSSTKAQIVYWPIQNQANFMPALSVEEQKPLIDFLKLRIDVIPEDQPNVSPYLWEYNKKSLILQPVGALGRTWAYIIILLDQKPQEYDYLILDSASLSIAQDLLRKRYIEERKLYTENLWMDDLLHKRLNDEKQIESFIGADYKKLNELPYRVCLIESNSLDENQYQWSMMNDSDESERINLSLMLRSLFEQYSFYPLITLRNNRIIVAAFDLNPKKPAKKRLLQVFESLLKSFAKQTPDNKQLLIGVGKTNVNMIQASSSYQEAIQAVSMYACFKAPVLFFEDLGVFQLLFNFADREVLQGFVDNYLEPLIKHDQTKGSELLRTLKVYLDSDGSKKNAAQKLFVVRQSLYYRLDKISELLGENYMDSENRLALQVALRAYQLLHPEVKMDVNKIGQNDTKDTNDTSIIDN